MIVAINPLGKRALDICIDPRKSSNVFWDIWDIRDICFSPQKQFLVPVVLQEPYFK